MGQNGTGPNGTRNSGPRCIALVGPFQSGKTTLLEAILARTGAIQRQGTVDAGTTVGDASKEARHHKMSVEATFATTNFMGDSYTFVDCPGSIEFIQDMRSVLPAVDAAVVVCEADEKKVPQLQLILRELEDQNIPHFLFLNKIDKADKRVRETVKLLQPASRVPLLLRQIPIWNGDIISGFVDLALERAFVYKEHAPSEIIDLKGDDLDREKEARFTMLETLADHDDELMEQLLEDIEPPRDKVFDDLAKELRDRIVCPVLLGVATRSNGVLRLLKALRHEAPGVDETAAASRRQGRQRRGRAGAQDVPHHARRQDVDCAAARRPGRRRHDAYDLGRRCRARVGCVQADGPALRETRTGGERRDGCLRQARQRQDRRHAVVRQAAARGARASEALCAGARHRGAGQGAQGRRQARPGLHQADGRRSLADCRAQCRKPRGGDLGPGRNASARCGRTARRPFRGAGVDAAALGRLPRDHPQADHAARPAQEAVRRPWPVRRRRAGDQAAAARVRLQVRRPHHRRRGAAQLHPGGGRGRRRRAQARTARFSGGRSVRRPGRRLLPHGRIPPIRRSARPAASASSKACRSASRCCWSRSIWSRSCVRPRRPRR